MNRTRISIGSVVLVAAALVGCVTEDANYYYDRPETVGTVIDDGYSVPAPVPSQTQYQLTSTAAPQSNYGSTQPAYPSANGVDAVLTMYQEGVSEQAILDFIASSNYPYDPSAEEINALFERGVSSRIVVAMIERGEDVIESGIAEENYASANYATSQNVAPAPAAAYAPQSNRPDVRQDYYNELAPHGEWVYISDYGWGWRPRIAVTTTSWRPYFDGGYWRYSDVGWYWNSTYDWGWLPFHYGRWNHHGGHGWVWYPGDTWGPAWVSWRTHPDYFGWAPLPYHATYHTGVGFYYRGSRVSFSYGFGLSSFHYSFIPRRHFANRNFHRHRLAGNVHYNCYTHSEVHHHYGYDRGRRSPVNKGVHVHDVEKAAGRKIDRVALRKADVGVVRRNRAGRGDKDVVYRPDIEDGQGVRGQSGRGRTAAPRSRTVTENSRRSESPTQTSLRSALAKETASRGPVVRSGSSPSARSSSPTSSSNRTAARKATVPQASSIANRSVAQPRSSTVSSSRRSVVSRRQAPTASPSASRSATRKLVTTQRSYGPANGSFSTSRRSSTAIPVRSSVTQNKRVSARDLSGSTRQSTRSYTYGVNRSVSTPSVSSRSPAASSLGNSRSSASTPSARNSGSRSASARAPSSRAEPSYTPSRAPTVTRSSGTTGAARSISTPPSPAPTRAPSSRGGVSPRSSSPRSSAAPSRSSSSKSSVTSRSGGFGSSSSSPRSTSTPSRATVSRGASSR